MRGLKRNQPYKHYRPRQVASFTDAWIETYQSAGVFSQCQSHLLQTVSYTHLTLPTNSRV